MLLIFPLLTFICIFLAIYKKAPKDLLCGRTIFLLTCTILSVLTLLSTELLSIFQAITPVAISLFWICSAIISLSILVLWNNKNLNELKKFITSFFVDIKKCFQHAPLNISESILLISIIIIVTLIGITAFIAPPNNWDSMTYHMSRVAHWIQNQSINNYPTNIPRQIIYQPYAEFAILHFQILTGSDTFANYIQYLSLLASLIAISLIAKFLTINRFGQIAASVFCVTIPMLILQGSSTQNDLTVAFFILSTLSFLLLLNKQTHIIFSISFALSLGFALLTKGIALIYLAPFIFWLAINKARENKFLFFKHAFIILLISSTILLGYIIRYSKINKTVGVNSSASHLMMKKFSPNALLSNILRNVRLHLATPSVKINTEIEEAIENIHKFIKIKAADSKTTFGVNERAFNTMPFHEDHAGNLIHLLLTIICLAIYAFPKKDKESYASAYLYCLAASFLMFCIIFKWQPWGSRLQLSLFMVACPLMAKILIKNCHKTLIFMTCLILIFCSLLWIFKNESRPWVGEKNIFNTERIDQYFTNNNQLAPSYKQSTQYLTDNLHSNIGLICSGDSWEYPLWVLLKEKTHQEFRIEHIKMENDSTSKKEDYPLGEFTPDAILMLHPTEQTKLNFQGVDYIKTRQFFDTSIFAKDLTGIRIKDNLRYHLAQTIEYMNKSKEYAATSNKPPQKIIQFKREYLNEIKSLDIEELNKIYNDWGNHVRNEFIKGVELSLLGYAAGNQQKYLYGQRLLSLWFSWYFHNQSSIMEALRKY